MNDDTMTAERPAEFRLDDAEWDARVKLAAAYRLVEYYGWTEQIYGHLTARVPGPENHFLINPWGLNYEEVTASNMVKIDVDGHVVAGGKHTVNFAGFIIHSAIHMTRSEENHVVMHTHTRAGMAIAALKEGLLPISMLQPCSTTDWVITRTRAHRCIQTNARASCNPSGRTRR